MVNNIKIFLSFLILFLFSQTSEGQSIWEHGSLKVTPDGHYLQYEDGTPFFWLGDTAWELFHRLKIEEIEKYLENRKEKGFNVIQAVVLAEMDGLRKPNQYGHVPFINMNPGKPNEKYFELIDQVVEMAFSRKMFIGLLPTWGDKVTLMWGQGPVVFNEDNAFKYGKWIGNRYKVNPNIIWILGGDRPALNDSSDWRPVWRAMAKGILEGTENKALISYHTAGGENSTSQMIHNEDWLDINMMQSGHGGGHDVPVWLWIARDYNLKPTKPTLDSEPNYEDHPVNPWPAWDPANGYFRAYDVRKQTYRSVFAGACGVTYGHHSIWQFWNPREEKINYADRYWTDALDQPGAFQVGYLKNLISSRPSLNRIPNDLIVTNGQGEKGEHICSFYDKDGKYLMVYLPVGKTISVSTIFLNCEKINAWWFNPRDGKAVLIGELLRKEQLDFTPLEIGSGKDWVLVLDDPKFNFIKPGK